MRVSIVRPDGKGDYTTIQAAIDAWAAGDRVPAKILVRPGQYTEQIEIDADGSSLILNGR